MTMYENVDVYDELADKIIGWMDPAHQLENSPSAVISKAYWLIAKSLKSKIAPSHERQIALRKLLESHNWAMRCREQTLGFGADRHAADWHAIDNWIDRLVTSDARSIAYHYWVAHDEVTRVFGNEEFGFERVQTARLFLESADAAVRAYLESLAEQQKQELRVVSQS